MTQTARGALGEFLLERIAEDVDVLTRPESYQHASHGSDALGTYSPYCRTCRQMVWGTRERALAECEAKRRIVEFYAGPHGQTYALRFLALPYDDHPDFREEWRI